jgi:excisionase family DNA binding protein
MSERKLEPTGEFLDPKTFARVVDLHRETIYRAIASGDLIAVKIRGAIRLPRSQLDALVIDGNCDADNQAEQDEW